MQSSICKDVKKLTREITQCTTYMSDSRSFVNFFESLLTFRKTPGENQAEINVWEALVKLRYVEGKNDVADKLENFYDCLLKNACDELSMKFVAFICHFYALSSVDTSLPSAPRFFMQPTSLTSAVLKIPRPAFKAFKLVKKFPPAKYALPQSFDAEFFPTLPESHKSSRNSEEAFEKSLDNSETSMVKYLPAKAVVLVSRNDVSVKNLFNTISIEKTLESLEKQKSRVLRMFCLLTSRKFFRLKSCALDVCASFTNSHGFIAIFNGLEPFAQITSLLSTFCNGLNRQLMEDEKNSTVWLMDILYEMCSSIGICSLPSEFFFSDIFSHLLGLYFRYIEAWVQHGQCLFDFEEFFVTSVSPHYESEDRNYWTKGFLVNEKLVPKSFLSVVDRILIAGKSANLKRRLKAGRQIVQFSENFESSRPNCCKTSEFFSLKADQEISEEFDSLLFVQKHAFLERSINNHMEFILKNCDSKIENLHFLLQDCRLEVIFGALREIYLGANGFFTSSLASNFFPAFQAMLKHTQSSLDTFFPFIFNHLIDDAIHYASIDISAFRNFAIRLISDPLKFAAQFSPLSEFFEISCEIPWPCNVVVTESILQWMKKVFNFLLALRWASWAIDDAWKFLAASGDDFRFLKKHQLVLHQREMKHFLQQLEVYVLHQTVDVCWTDFKSNLADCQNLDDIYAAHSNYVNEIVVRCLLTPKAQPVFKCIKKLLECAINFRRLIVDEENEDQAIEVYMNFNAMSKALITVVEKLAARVYQPHLSELLIRLNFNHFYY